MEQTGQGHNYRQLAEEIGEVLQAAAETAEKMQEKARAEADRMREEAWAEADRMREEARAEAERMREEARLEADRTQEHARAEADRIREEADEQLRAACADARRMLDDARMEGDMMRAEAEWQAQEIVAQARRQATERLADADSRLSEAEQAESRVIDRLAGVGQVLADTMAALRRGAGESPAAPSELPDPEIPRDDADAPTAKVYFVEFPPVADADPAADEAAVDAEPPDEPEIVLSETAGASLFSDDEERSEWAPPTEDLPTWWTRGGAQAT